MNLINIEKTDILDKQDYKKLEELKDELQETFQKTQIFRTRTEMEVSVLNDLKFPTPASKYWQAVREQDVMFTQLVYLSFDYRETLIEIKQLQKEFEEEKDELEKELLKIKIEKKTFSLKEMQRVAKARIREIENWSDIKSREAQKMKPEELSEVDNHQLISYTKRWIKQALISENNGSPSEKQNLLGQLRSGILACKKKGLLSEILSDLPSSIKNQILTEYKEVNK